MVEFIPPVGFTISPQDQGTDDAKDSDADPITGLTVEINLSIGENDLTWDAGMYQTADLEILKTCEDATAGGLVTCTITINNYGPALAENVDVKDILPLGVDWVSGDPSQGVCVNGICQLGDVPVGTPVTITVTGAVGSDVLPGDLTNEATVFSDTPDDLPDDNTVEADFTVSTLADIGVTKVDLKEPVGPTEGFLYELEVTNYGPVRWR